MALQLLAANNAQSVLAAGISASATSLTLNTGTGALFPSPVSGTSFFKLTLIDAATGSLTEIVHVTARAGDVFTIQRGQEGTVPRAWSANDIAANMMTAGTLSYILGNFQPLDPTLTALAALVGVANKLPYFNGDDTAALTDLTQVGRDIIGKSTIADILTYLGLGEGSALPVGIPVPWPLAAAPAGWLKCNGAAFTAAQYPKLALAYPALKLPDLRGEFLRGWDDGRGVDSGRVLLSVQYDALQNITGDFWDITTGMNGGGSGAFSSSTLVPNLANMPVGGGFKQTNYSFDASRVARTSAETRPRNIAFNYIVRAA
ncbi:phage tail protein [Enterobacter roggenkampii]|uniref:phage tail protein n=1 Tax=Enterobacter roggenkampii TaxID=1812935 RepID=UPI002076115F|nr:phage tail protein [Enterobacter roggenkampii]MCM6993600.1 phage tail protein [Enterobacter roggenkampii]